VICLRIESITDIQITSFAADLYHAARLGRTSPDGGFLHDIFK
jgi:hypothetical protein